MAKHCQFQPVAILLCVSLTIIPIFATGPQLRHVNVVFRHGDRTPVREELYPNDNYGPQIFEPFGLGELTNIGKQRAYELGMVLKLKYGGFLGPFYKPSLINARSTNTGRTKMTLQLALASLFPPVGVERWNKRLNWQPIPYKYVPKPEDNLMLQIYYCDKYLSAYNATLMSTEAQQALGSYHELMEKASIKSGTKMSTVYDLYNLEQSLKAKSSLRMLPKWGVDLINELYDPAITQLYLYNLNPTLKRRNGGVLLRQMVKNMRAVMNGSASEKIHLYSGHDVNVAAMLFALDVFEPHTPAYTSGVFLELYQMNNDYYVKVVYYLGIPSKVQDLRLKGCDTYCPFEKFVQLIQDVLPTEADICGQQITDDVVDANDSPL